MVKQKKKALVFPEFPFIPPYVLEEHGLSREQRMKLSQWIRDVLAWREGLVAELQDPENHMYLRKEGNHYVKVDWLLNLLGAKK